MKRIALAVLATILIAGIAAAGWYYRPWSDYSPARMAALENPEDFPLTFQRMDEILPHRMIEAGRPEPLPRALAPLDVSYEWDGQVKELDAFIEEAGVIGLAVLRDGVLVHEDYFHGAGPDTRFTSWSVAKSVVATLIGMAWHEGLIADLDDPVSAYAPQFEGTAYGDATLRNLLMMSAGVAFNEEYSPDRPSDVRPLFFNAFIMGRNVDAMVAEIVSDRDPGEDLHYASPNSHVLSAVVRGVYGGDLAGIVQERIWIPLGMEHDASWLQNVPGDDGVAIGYCCLQASAVDYARFGQLYLQDGVWDGERLLPEGWTDMVSIPSMPFMEPGAGNYPGRGYGLHFWVPENYDGEFFAAGVYGQYVWIDRRRNVVVAMNAGDPTWGQRGDEARAALRAIAAEVSSDGAAS
jgi:CubicO group peptidase (beta-lactamase class C family)